jgi:phosphopantothenoylcysteine decarboxylase/phosphopantothenate--cysteine ligase
VGWKYEVDGNRASVVAAARKQIADCRTDACVANGPAYGTGFGLVNAGAKPAHCSDAGTLFEALESLIHARAGKRSEGSKIHKRA